MLSGQLISQVVLVSSCLYLQNTTAYYCSESISLSLFVKERVTIWLHDMTEQNWGILLFYPTPEKETGAHYTLTPSGFGHESHDRNVIYIGRLCYLFIRCVYWLYFLFLSFFFFFQFSIYNLQPTNWALGSGNGSEVMTKRLNVHGNGESVLGTVLIKNC